MKKIKLRSPYNEKYFYFDPKQKNNFLHIFGAGIVYPDNRYKFSKIRNTYLFEYIIKGEGYIEFNGKRYVVTEGDTIILKQGTNVKYGSQKNTPYTKIWFSATGSFLKGIFEGCNTEENSRLIIKRVSTYPLFEKALRQLSNTEANTDIFSHIILDIFLAVYGESCNYNKDIENIADHLKFFIDSFPQSKIDIETIISQYAVSNRTAVKLFRERYGTTPSRYIKQVRLEKSCDLLKDTTLTISEISAKLGFCDQSYFSTEFLKKYGVYPSEYRKKEILHNA